jgi:hypothetical protein
MERSATRNGASRASAPNSGSGGDIVSTTTAIWLVAGMGNTRTSTEERANDCQ